MKRTIALIFSMFFTAALVAGCSSIPLFGSHKTEDYNQITYGDEEPATGTSWSNRTRLEPQFQTPYQRSISSEFANQQQTQQQAQAAPTETVLDPTDEETRKSIEAAREGEQGEDQEQIVRQGRTTKKDLWDNTPGDGSLWSSSGDVNFFFTRSKVRQNGDIVSIKIQDPLIRQVADEVKRTLSPAEQQVEMAIAAKTAANAQNTGSTGSTNPTATQPSETGRTLAGVTKDDLDSSDAAEVYQRMQKAVQWSQLDLSKVIGLKPDDELRAEVIDRYPNGNYKIRAVKQITYRGRLRMMSLVGVAPQGDFDDQDVIKSGKMYEYQVRIAR